jgi:hypothetical protein
VICHEVKESLSSDLMLANMLVFQYFVFLYKTFYFFREILFFGEW